MILRRAVLTFGLFALLAPASAFGFTARSASPSADPPGAPSGDDRALIEKAQDYLSGLKGAQGRFTQIDPKGHASSGRFFLLKPGKARFQYDPPAALLVVADGLNVSVYDRKLKSFDQYPLAQTPLALLLGRAVRFDDRVAASIADRSATGFTLDLRDAKHPADGRLLLGFAAAPLSLTGWTIVDAQNQKTMVRLSDLKRKTDFDPAVFVLKSPAAATP